MASKRPALSDNRPLSDSTITGSSKLENVSPSTNNTGDDQVPQCSFLPPGILRQTLPDVLFMIGILIMLIWPWLFFGAVWAKSGIKITHNVAAVIIQNPHTTTYLVTLISSVNTIIVTFLFSVAIVRFTQEWVTHKGGTPDPLHLRILLALRHQRWRADGKVDRNAWGLAALVFICFLTFPNLTSSISTLITPVPFNRTSILTGTELNFSATDTDCVDWFKLNPIPNTCNWKLYNGLWFTNCLGENQVVDVLEAGRGSILASIPGNSQSLTFSQLGAQSGLHFLGSIRGVLPLGPNGVAAFDTLDPNSLEDSDILSRVLSYNYTLDHQGITAEPSCQYTQTSPIVYTNSTTTSSLNYSVPSCHALGQNDVLIYTPDITIPGNSLYTLMYWACQDATKPNTYYVYLRGVGLYSNSIGNIMCTISQLQPATYSVMYESTKGIFTTTPSTLLAHEPTGNALSVFITPVMTYALQGLGNLMREGQNSQANLVAESVITFGVKDFNQQPEQQSDTYLRLYGQMIQGIVEYLTTYTRLLYSAIPNPPSSCLRQVNGSVNYQVLGWFVKAIDVAYLIPITLANVAAFFVLLRAMVLAKGTQAPCDPRPVNYDTESGEEVPDEWRTKIALNPISLLKSIAKENDFRGKVANVGESATKEGFNDVRNSSG